MAANTSFTAQIMALVLNGIVTETLPWGLIPIGAFIAIGIEVLGIPSLPLAVERLTGGERASADAGSVPGVLSSSRLIVGGPIMSVILTGLAARHLDEKFNFGSALGAIATSNIVAMSAYVVLLVAPLYLVALRIRNAIG